VEGLIKEKGKEREFVTLLPLRGIASNQNLASNQIQGASAGSYH
jgi:hypothetical protein